MMRYLLDTNVLSEPIKRRPSSVVLERLAEHSEVCAIAAPTWHELWFGCTRLVHSRRRDALTHYLEQAVKAVFPVIPYGGAAAERHAEQRSSLAGAGAIPPYVDGQIAAIAEVHGLVLVTRNVSDFVMYPNLQVENWFVARGAADRS